MIHDTTYNLVEYRNSFSNDFGSITTKYFFRVEMHLTAKHKKDLVLFYTILQPIKVCIMKYI